MNDCPTPQELEHFLEEELGDARQHELTQHVSACARCQAALEHMTAPSGELHRIAHPAVGPASRRSGERDDCAPADSASLSAFLTQLKESTPPSISRAPLSGMSAPGSSLQEPPAVAGYEILGELGRGGMGVVYKARHVALDRLVALKMILAGVHAGPKDLERFRQEAAAVARLHHPNIVQVFDIGNAGGCPYFALEYVEQGSLAQHLRGEPQPLRAVLLLLETLARAMAYAHQCGIIHRDLKPANILLSTKGEAAAAGDSLSLALATSYIPKITDFGLAKRVNDESTRSHSGEVVGTPSYMAPEQADIKGREIGPATDVYALGAIFYEMLTGRPPFKGATSLDTLLQVLHEEPVRPRRLRPQLPRDVETICLKCLEKNPNRRYVSAAALADDLRRARRGDPIEARPVGIAERGWKWARRRPVSAALVAGIFLVTLLGFAGVSWLWRDAILEKNEAESQRQQARSALYYSRIAQSQLQWRVNDLPGALRSLDDYRRPGDRQDRRGWEWYYLQTLYRPELFTFIHPRQGLEGSVAFHPDGGTIASVVRSLPDQEGDCGEFRLWDAASGNLIHERTLPSPFHRLAFRPDGKRLVLGSTDGRVMLWDTRTYREVWQDSIANCRVTGLAFSPDGKTVAAAAMASADSGERGKIKFWDAGKGTMKQVVSTSQGDGFHCLAFHPTLPLLASGGEDNAVRIWNVTTGRQERSLQGHKSAVYGVAFSPDGKRLVSAGNNGTLKIWNLEQTKEAVGGLLTGTLVPQSLTGRTGAILSLAFSPDSRYFAYCGTDKTVRIWDVESGTGHITFRGHTAVVESVQFSPDGQRLVSCSPAVRSPEPHGEVKVWDFTRHPEYATLARTSRDVESVAFQEDGRHLASVTVDGELQVWDANSGVPRARHRLAISAEPVNPAGVLATFAPDGRRLAARSREDRSLVRVWDVERGAELLVCRGHRLPVFCLRFSSDGRYLASCACDEKPDGQPFEIKVWDAASGAPLAAMSGVGRVFTLSFSPDGRWLAAGNDDKVRLFDWEAEREVLPSLSAHKSNVTALAFHPDGRSLASAGINDVEVYLWDIKRLLLLQGNDIAPLRSLAAPLLLCDLVFSPDGKRLAGASRDLIKMWDAETGVEVLTLRGAPQRYRDPPFNARVVFHPDGTRLAGTNWNESISVWDAPPHTEDGARLQQQKARRQAADDRAMFWHLQEAEQCLDHQNWNAARFHLRRLFKSRLGNENLRAR